MCSSKSLTLPNHRRFPEKMSAIYTRDLLRAARIALRMSHEELAVLARVSRPTLTKIELTRENVGTRSIEKVQEALEAAGIKFLPPEQGIGPGFRIPERTGGNSQRQENDTNNKDQK